MFCFFLPHIFFPSVDAELEQLKAVHDPEGAWAAALREVTEDQWLEEEVMVTVPLANETEVEEEVPADYDFSD